MKATPPVDAYVQELVLVLETIRWFVAFFFFLFSFFEKYTKRRELLCYFLTRTLLTFKYPVFIRGTNSNSKVHPCTERTDGKPLVQESCENATLTIVTNPRAAPRQRCLCVCGYSESCVLVLSLKQLHKPEVALGDMGQ